MYAIRSYYGGSRKFSGYGLNTKSPICSRITSYNVCYTKLLRGEPMNAKGWNGGRIWQMLIEWNGIRIIMLIFAVCLVSVITSYSIHYTKLYDLQSKTWVNGQRADSHVKLIVIKFQTEGGVQILYRMWGKRRITGKLICKRWTLRYAEGSS